MELTHSSTNHMNMMMEFSNSNIESWILQGIWVGMICGTFLQTLILLYIICKTNWNTEVEHASERMQQWGAELQVPENKGYNFSH